jgi:hypothetical protein
MPMKPLAGFFLALACLLGIASTGSVFELAYGDPDLGLQATLWILGLSLPGTVAALLVAIRINKPA